MTRRGKMARAAAGATPVYNFRIVNRAGTPRPGPISPRGEPLRGLRKAALSAGGPQAHPERASRFPEPPAGAAGREGAGENPTATETPDRGTASRAPRGAQLNGPGGTATRSGPQGPLPPGPGASRARSREAGRAGRPRRATDGPQQGGAKEGRSDQRARTGADAAARPPGHSERDGKAAGTRPPGPERKSRGGARRPGASLAARRRTGPGNRRRARRAGADAATQAQAQRGECRTRSAQKKPGNTLPGWRAYRFCRGHRRAPRQAARVGPWPRAPGRRPPSFARGMCGVAAHVAPQQRREPASAERSAAAERARAKPGLCPERAARAVLWASGVARAST